MFVNLLLLWFLCKHFFASVCAPKDANDDFIPKQARQAYCSERFPRRRGKWSELRPGRERELTLSGLSCACACTSVSITLSLKQRPRRRDAPTLGRRGS